MAPTHGLALNQQETLNSLLSDNPAVAQQAMGSLSSLPQAESCGLVLPPAVS